MKSVADGAFKLLMTSIVVGAGVAYEKIYLFHIALLIFTFIFLIYKLTLNGNQNILQPVRNRHINVLYIMLTWYALGIIWALSMELAVKYIYYVGVGVLIVYLINSYAVAKAKYEQLWLVFRNVFLAAAIIGCLESFFEFRLPTSAFVLDYSQNADQFIGLDDDAIAYILTSPTAFWGNTNNFAISMLIIFPYFLLFNNWLIKLFGTIMLLILVMMSGSRAALLGMFVCIAIYFALFMNRFRLVVMALSVSILLISMYFISSKPAAFFNENFGYLLDFIFDFKNSAERIDSVGIRQVLILNGIEALWNSNTVGVGGGGSEVVQYNAGLDVVSMHNFWVEILVEAGLWFFIVFVFWYISVARKLFIIFRRHESHFYRYHSGCLFFSLMGFIPGCVSASSVIYFFPMWIMFGMSIAIIHLAIDRPNFE